MISVGISPVIGRPQPPFISQVRGILSFATTEPTAARKLLLNTTVGSLMIGTYWAKIDDLQVYAAHEAAMGHLNWKNPGRETATPVNAPTFTVDRGYSCAAANSRIDTNWNPGSGSWNYVRDSAMHGVWCLTNEAAAGASTQGAFVSTTSQMAAMNPRNGSDQIVWAVNQNANDTAANNNSTGLLIAKRTASAATIVSRNATQVSTSATVSAIIPSLNFFVGAINANGAGIANKTTRQIAMFLSGAPFTAQEETDFMGVMSSYLSQIGAV